MSRNQDRNGPARRPLSHCPNQLSQGSSGPLTCGNAPEMAVGQQTAVPHILTETVGKQNRRSQPRRSQTIMVVPRCPNPVGHPLTCENANCPTTVPTGNPYAPGCPTVPTYVGMWWWDTTIHHHPRHVRRHRRHEACREHQTGRIAAAGSRRAS